MLHVKISDLILVYEEEIKKNVKNKRKIFDFEKNKLEYLYDIKRVLESSIYDGGTYNIFLVYKPKIRVVMSQKIYDKIINHYVARFILIPKLSKYLSKYNFATRKNMGTKSALDTFKMYFNKYKNKGNFYYLKLDIKKYFYNIDHNILLSLIKKDLNVDEYNLVKNIILSTNRKYVNLAILKYKERGCNEVSLYFYDKGLPIGNMTSQFLAIFYLSKLHHYIKCNLNLDFVVYMDDYVIFSESKEKLVYALNSIIDILSDYKLEINNKKTYIKSGYDGIIFLGHRFNIFNNKTIIKKTNESKSNIIKNIKLNKYLFKKNNNYKRLFSSLENYKYSDKNISKKYMIDLIYRYFI